MSAGLIDEETKALLALTLVPGIGPKLTQALLDRFGSACKVRHATVEDMVTIPRLSTKVAQNLRSALNSSAAEDELLAIERGGVHLLRFDEPDYPACLKTTSSAPAILYVRGTILPTDQHAVAIVGSRNCSEYGRRVTEQLARGLVRSGYTVVSGLARGTDSYAHRAALDAGGRTLAVLAGGLSKIYPPEHGNLADAVARQGALVSEQSMRQAPLRDMFPARNRIISGLSRGVVIIEAGEKSGALITARHALEQGREVFAVPGPIDSPQSAGTLGLLRQGATLIRGVDDILETLGNLPLFQPPPPSNPQSPSEVPLPSPSTAPPVPPPVPTGLSDEQLTIWNALGASPIHLDDLAAALGLAVQQISSQLLMFEMRGLVRRVPGNRYERAR